VSPTLPAKRWAYTNLLASTLVCFPAMLTIAYIGVFAVSEKWKAKVEG
jgi:hypothetical protein